LGNADSTIVPFEEEFLIFARFLRVSPYQVQQDKEENTKSDKGEAKKKGDHTVMTEEFEMIGHLYDDATNQNSNGNTH
jgi:hypothetical protein